MSLIGYERAIKWQNQLECEFAKINWDEDTFNLPITKLKLSKMDWWELNQPDEPPTAADATQAVQDLADWRSERRDLVIGAFDYMFNGEPFNDRWFHTTDFRNRLVNCDFDVVNSDEHLNEIGSFSKLRCLKIHRITIVQLNQLAEGAPSLTDLEIGFLDASECSEGSKAMSECPEGPEAVNLKAPVKLPKLERLHLTQILPNTATVTFDTELLDAVYLGKRFELRISECSLVITIDQVVR